MRIEIEINELEEELKKAIAFVWNERSGEELTYEDIKEVNNKNDILNAIPYLDANRIKIVEIRK